MNERTLENIKQYLQSEEAQERIRQNILRAHAEATVTIGRAADLFKFTENQLRDWENRGLLNPIRHSQYTGRIGHRQYTPAELDKLAIIRELINTGYAPGEIPGNIDEIWNLIHPSYENLILQIGDDQIEHLHIDQRTDHLYKELFWRYFASQVLRLSLMLICEDIYETNVGLMLPLKKKDVATAYSPDELPKVGASLIGWNNRSRSFHVFLDYAPSFEYPSDFRIFPLQAMKDTILQEDAPKDGTLIIVPRKANPLTLSVPVVETIRRLLTPIYEDVQDWWPYFGQGMRDLPEPVTDFNNSISPSDDILNGLADMVVRLGGRLQSDQDRWRFCCILLQKDPMIPLQQRTLVVRAQSKHAPHRVGITINSSDQLGISLSLRAFQSGHIIYRHRVSAEDYISVHRELEGPISSAIAVPIGGGWTISSSTVHSF